MKILLTIKVLIVSMLFIFLSTGSSYAAVITDGLVAEYKLDGNLSDSFGGNANLTNVQSISYVNDHLGNTGSAAYIPAGSLIHGSTSITNNFAKNDESRTIAFWGKITDDNIGGFLFRYGLDYYKVHSDFGLTYNEYTKALFVDTGRVHYNLTNFNYKGWNHYMLSYDSALSMLKVYINGELKHSFPVDINLTTAAHYNGLYIGQYMGLEMSNFLVYDRALSNDELNQILNEVPKLGVVSVGTGNVNLSNQDNVNISVMGATDFNSDPLAFSYSFDNQNFEALSGSLTNTTFSTSLDLSEQNDGPIALYIKANDGYGDSNIVSTILNKNTAIPEINISESVVDSETKSMKYIMVSDLGTKYYNINTSGLCDATLEFTAYSDLLFENASDNGSYICYKVDLGNDNIHYKLATQVDGIIGSMPIVAGDVFSGYKQWRKSVNISTSDRVLAFLKMMVSTSRQSSNSTSTNYPSTLIDINGDGLVDMLYSNYSYYYTYDYGGSNPVKVTNKVYKYGIMINNGNYTFTPVYRCVKDVNTYYGNCADISNY